MLPSLADLIDLLRSDVKRIGREKASRCRALAWHYDGRPDDGLPAQMLAGTPINFEDSWTS